MGTESATIELLSQRTLLLNSGEKLAALVKYFKGRNQVKAQYVNHKFDTDLEEDEREKIVEKEQEEREKEIVEHLKIADK